MANIYIIEVKVKAPKGYKPGITTLTTMGFPDKGKPRKALEGMALQKIKEIYNKNNPGVDLTFSVASKRVNIDFRLEDE